MFFQEFNKIYQNIKNNNNYSIPQKQQYLKKISVTIFCKSEFEYHQCCLFKTDCPLIVYYREF